MRTWLQVFVLITLIFNLTACSKTTGVQKQTISAAMSVPVNDPVIRRLTDATSSIDIVADGEFNPGNYHVNNMLVTIAPNTRFNLKLSLPIKDPAAISTKLATGSFTCSENLTINTIPVPKSIELTKGNVSAEVDLVHSMTAFLVSLLQASGESNDLRAMIESVRIEKATLALRPGSTLKFGTRDIAIGPDSNVVFSEVIVDHSLDYRGLCTLNLHFAKGCRWVGEKVSCEFEGGTAHLQMVATKVDDRLTLTTDKDRTASQKVVIEPCNFKFGKNKRSNALSKSVNINVKDLTWKHRQGDSFSNLHILGLMNLANTYLDLKTDSHETRALFPDTVDARLEITEDKEGKTTHFATTESATAKEGQITIAKKASRLELMLGQTTIGPVSFDKSGALQFVLENGIAKLKSLEWHGNKSNFVLTTAGSSTLSLPEGMLVEKGEGAGHTHLALPITIRLGAATIKGPGGQVKLANLAGDLTVDVDKEVQITSKLDFSIPDSKFFGGQQADVKVRGLDFSVINGKTGIHLRNCTVMLPDQVLVDSITKHIPDSFQFDLNKTLSENKKWRYRNAVASTVSVKNFKVTQMDPLPPNILKFSAEGDVDVNGTIEKTGIVGGGGDSSKWEEKPWSLAGHAAGEGHVKYSFKPSGHGLKSQLVYELDLSVPLSNDIKLDWSQVAGGLLKFAERKIIVGHLRKITVPIKYQGQMELFAKTDTISSNFNVTKLAVKSVRNDMQVDFAAEGAF